MRSTTTTTIGKYGAAHRREAGGPPGAAAVGTEDVPGECSPDHQDGSLGRSPCRRTAGWPRALRTPRTVDVDEAAARCVQIAIEAAVHRREHDMLARAARKRTDTVTTCAMARRRTDTGPTVAMTRRLHAAAGTIRPNAVPAGFQGDA